ncbi:inner centromere protein [Dorcoceras hygrometricum]|uniref:Inner centromere protein n=1 Tax=Dorcoceras hygrometricum TaxID=472368 RepID=A0A2Z7BI14_9LAMI|nr:inner centromere protein [Dorcoceras hygrometricum]
MGSSHTKDKCSPNEKLVEYLKNKVMILQGEINEMMSIRESEYQSYEHDSIFFELKQAEWKRERRKLKAELKRLRMACEEKEEMRLKCKCDGCENGWPMGRDETVEKWKQLYLAVKIELDDLIQRTHREERRGWKTEEEDMLMELKKELISKQERMEILEAKLMSMEDQESRRQREMDILRQSLRIMSHKKRAATTSARGQSRNSDI